MIERINTALEGRYLVERELGAGGMATVYLAEDPKHDRKVAVKVLHPELSAVIGAERFLAEIRTTANLQHPHILPLFDSGEADGLLFYVMPFVDGESLRDRIDRERQLPVDEAVRLTKGIASALDYAHRNGIVHRDIKPANILLHDGQPLVADFGIALALTAAGSSGRMTETGLSLGTPHYMSPEQASGEGTLDPRSDVYALGCVLYEMLVGDPPFPGSTPQAVLAKVLTSEPERVRAQRASVPRHVDAVVARAMERIPADRFQSVAEMRAALADEAYRHGEFAQPGEGAAGAASPQSGTALVGALSVLVLALAVIAGIGWMRAETSGPGSYRVLGLGPEAAALDPAFRAEISPDGRLLAAVDTSGFLRVLSLDGAPEITVPELDRSRVPRFSPDGSRIGFVSVNGAQPDGAELFWIPSTGTSAPTRIGTMPGPEWAWGLEGDVYFSREGRVRRYPAPGAAEEAVPQPDDLLSEVLQVLPDGRILVELPRDPVGTRLALLDPETGKLVVPDAQPDPVGTRDARYLDGHLFWTTTDGVLYAARFDPDGAGVTGPGIRLADDVAPASGTGALFSVARDGSLILGTGMDGRAGRGENLAWVDVDGNAEVIHEPWAEEFQDFDHASPSPDGRWIAVEVDGSRLNGGPEERPEIWILDARDRQSYRLTFDGVASQPQWLIDGRVAYIRDPYQDAATIVAQPFDRSGSEEVLVDLDRAIQSFDVLPDGSGLLLEVAGSGQADDDDIWLQRFDGSAAAPWLAEPFDQHTPRVSPDGRWVSYRSNETGRWELYVRSFPTPGRPWRISEDGAGACVWGDDGQWMYFAALGGLQARLLDLGDGVRVQGSGEFFSLTPFEVGADDLAVLGERFLMIVEPASATGIRQLIHLNVFDEIERRIAAEEVR